MLPDRVPTDNSGSQFQAREELIKDVLDGVTAATMAIRITPYILSRINWENPRQDPLFRQFLPLKSVMIPDHPKLTLDSLHEEADSPVKGLVHRYPEKALFLRTHPHYHHSTTRTLAPQASKATDRHSQRRPSARRTACSAPAPTPWGPTPTR